MAKRTTKAAKAARKPAKAKPQAATSDVGFRDRLSDAAAFARGLELAIIGAEHISGRTDCGLEEIVSELIDRLCDLVVEADAVLGLPTPTAAA